MIRTYFDKDDIRDVDYALSKEFIITSGNGLYTTSSISGCNTRKYHGLLIAPQNEIDDTDHVLLSSLDEVIKVNEVSYNLGMHIYPGKPYPEGLNYLAGFYRAPVPKWIFEIQKIRLVKELVLSGNDDALLIRYTLENAPAPVDMQLIPLLAFRNIHKLSHANMSVNRNIARISQGIKLDLYPGYMKLDLQVINKHDFIQAPDWYYNIEYPLEKARGYDFSEDLYTPGQFRLRIKKGETVIFSAGLRQENTTQLKNKFRHMVNKVPVPETMEDCLIEASGQFIIRKDNAAFVKAGYPWFGIWGRDSFISIPGLTLVNGDLKTFKTVLNSLIPDLRAGLFPNTGTGKNAYYNSVDTSLWFIWAIQQYAAKVNDDPHVWTEFGKPLNSILEHYAKGTLHNIKMDIDGLISAGKDGLALTWMDCIINGRAVTPRIGKAVEVNALWYNAICFGLQLAQSASDEVFVKKWSSYPGKISEAFRDNFMETGRPYLADCVDGGHKDWSMRPNQVIALSLTYSPVPPGFRRQVLETIKEELLTPRGLRTLSPKDPRYKGTYSGNQEQRDNSYHQGTVWPWLLGHFSEAYLKEYGTAGISFIEKLYNGFEPAIQELALYTLPELYNGGAPHLAAGAISQAWSVAELKRMGYLIQEARQKASIKSTIAAL